MRSPLPSTHLPDAATHSCVVRDDIAHAAIPAASWDALVPGHPLLSHAFLHALHDTGCAAPGSGWEPRYLTAWDREQLVGAMPLYAKTHSYGEYVFDWAWADAYRRHRRAYYPKLVAAIPFTPVLGARLLGTETAHRERLLAHALAMMSADGFSSLHVLFPAPDCLALCAAASMVLRHSVQFHWDNPGYRDFAEFLAAFSRDKRKKVRQERRRVADAGIDFVRLTGAEIGAADWDFFHACYVRTYRQHGATPYLSRAFFAAIGETMPENLLLVIGRRAGMPICAALDVYSDDRLWGRYWGAIEYVPGLHFEACYYQAIEFCIERGIRTFEGGAQGAHKLARGLLPVTTTSAHAIADPEFALAIREYCAHERDQVSAAVDELETGSPFRAPAPPVAPADA